MIKYRSYPMYFQHSEKFSTKYDHKYSKIDSKEDSQLIDNNKEDLGILNNPEEGFVLKSLPTLKPSKSTDPKHFLKGRLIEENKSKLVNSLILIIIVEDEKDDDPDTITNMNSNQEMGRFSRFGIKKFNQQEVLDTYHHVRQFSMYVLNK